ncbi:MAG: SagB family peptide dehydrogenase [Elusimicrobia bacterium]|nr:SagB family peptide dehydrogenase [Elusimicrobiota bacterium]
MPRRYSRASSLVLYWEGRGLVCEDYLTHRKARITAEVASLLDWFGTPRLVSESPKAANELVKLGFIRPTPSRQERTLDSWWWGAAARHFLFSTKDAHRPAPLKARLKYARGLRAAGPPPPLYKEYPRSRRVRLPRVTWSSAATRAIAGVRDVRGYKRSPMPLAAFSELLALTWGRRGTLKTETWGELLDKTSYSAGNRHPVEVYVVVASVEGLRPGVYHYDVRRHGLERLKSGDFAGLMRRIGNGQAWIRGASAYFLMTAVLERTMWKYRHDYALRTVFCDVGHLSQNLYVAAQGLGWGACTTYALNHSLAEGLLGLDGAREPFLALSMVGRPA